MTVDRVSQASKARRAKNQIKGTNPLYAHDPEKESGRHLTTTQVSKMFDVTTMTVYNWRNAKNLPFFHLEGGEKPPVRYDEGAVLHWASSHGIPVVDDDY